MEFITEIEKKKHIKHILGIEVETQKITMTMIFILAYQRMIWYTRTKSIILNQSDTQKVRLTCRESPSSYAA